MYATGQTAKAVLRATHTFIHMLLPSHRASPHLIWMVLISRPTEGRRLSWPGWLGEVGGEVVYKPRGRGE